LLKGFFKQFAFFAGVFTDKKARRAGVLSYTCKKAVFLRLCCVFSFFCVSIALLKKALVKPFFMPKRRLSKNCSKFIFF